MTYFHIIMLHNFFPFLSPFRFFPLDAIFIILILRIVARRDEEEKENVRNIE